MEYGFVYNKIIDRARNRTIDGYTEKHHITPKCLGGDDTSDNLVELTAREHFICHKLLAYMNPNNTKLWYAYNMMLTNGKGQDRKYNITSREYQELKENLLPSRRIRGKKLGSYKRSDYHKQLHSKLKTENNTLPYHGKKVFQYDLDGNLLNNYKSVSIAIKETGIKTIQSAVIGSQTNAGGYLWLYEENINNLKKIIDSAKYLRPCPHCGKHFDKQPWNMKRYHFENCKEK